MAQDGPGQRPRRNELLAPFQREARRSAVMPVYYDLSDLFDYARFHATVSGIQRVSLSILGRLAQKHPDGEVVAVSWDARRRCFMAYEASYFAGGYVYDRDALRRRFALSWSVADSARHWLKRAGQRRRPAEASIGRDRGRPVEWRRGDVLYVPGATWGLYGYRAGLRDAARQGVAVHQLIHDLIPLLASEHVQAGIPEIFASWLDELSTFVHGFIANSEATRVDLQAWLDVRQRHVPIQVVHLAHQLGACERGAGTADSGEAPASGAGEAVLDAARAPFVLCVGTREPRKNLVSVARAWQRLHVRLGADTPRLVVAGSRGWRNEAFESFVGETRSLDGRLLLVERATDRELAHLYRTCLFSVFMSFKEGWGLPIGEGLWLGRPVLCSNVSAMPEAGGELADYADPASVDAIEAAALRLIVDGKYREERAGNIAAARLRSWGDVAEDVWTALHLAR